MSRGSFNFTRSQLDTPRGDNWRHHAACRDEDGELFFPVGNTGPALLQTERAKAVCDRCPVVAECLEFALRHQEYGVAGGMSEDERAAHKRRLGIRVIKAAA